MKILLWQDVEKLGKRGEVVDVREGYARNYLFPRRLGSEPTPSMYKEFELAKRRAAKQEAVQVTESEAIAERLSGVTSVSIEVNTNEEGHLYGAVTPSMVSDALRDQGLKVEARCVEIAEPIKQVGTYEVTINLHREVKPKLKVWVLSTKAVKPEPAKGAQEKAAPPAPDKKPDGPAKG
jgi:large subunit ribosomal protein L9